MRRVCECGRMDFDYDGALEDEFELLQMSRTTTHPLHGHCVTR